MITHHFPFGITVSPLTVGGALGLLTVIFLAVRPNRNLCKCKADLTGKTAIVTGANSGIGYYTALGLAARNAKVILACRNKTRGEKARERIIARTGNKNVKLHLVNLGSLESVRQFARDIIQTEERLDILINNAGANGLPQVTTDDGLEFNFAVNHFGPFLLTLLLLDVLKNSAPSRIINVSSSSQRIASVHQCMDLNVLQGRRTFFFNMAKYPPTKLANLLFTRELARRLSDTGVATYCVDPGRVRTDICRRLHPFLRTLLSPFVHSLKTAEEGAQTSIHCAVSEDVREESGKYYKDCAPAENYLFVNPVASDPAVTRQFWEISERLTGYS